MLRQLLSAGLLMQLLQLHDNSHHSTLAAVLGIA
jgi:hypothetical protein